MKTKDFLFRYKVGKYLFLPNWLKDIPIDNELITHVRVLEKKYKVFYSDQKTLDEVFSAA